MQKLWLWIIPLLFLAIRCDMKNRSQKNEFEKQYYRFIKSRIHPATHLVRRVAGDRLTTLYANALAAMTLIHEGDFDEAEKIFQPFQRYQQLNQDHFHGFPQIWNAQTGLPDTTSIHWEGDSAFLLLALHYYTQFSDSSNEYQDLISSLVGWLSHRANSCEKIVAEGVADMYAALSPFTNNHHIQKSLERLRHCFFSHGQISSKDYSQNLNHIIRGALVFGDTSGFDYLDNFLHSEYWDKNSTMKLSGYKEFTQYQTINIEVTVQILLTLKIWQMEAKFKAFTLCKEIERRISSENYLLPKIPYPVINNREEATHTLSSFESVCYLLFYYWNLNPYAPGRKSADYAICLNDNTN